MDRAEFDRWVVTFGDELPVLHDAQRLAKIGAWLTETLTPAMIEFAVGYRTPGRTDRLLNFVDTHTASEALSWTDYFRREWIRRNRRELPAELIEDFLSVQPLNKANIADNNSRFMAILETLDWGRPGTWGPLAPPASPERLERLQLLYLVTRTSTAAYDDATAQAFLLGSNPILGDVSPLLAIADGARLNAWPILVALDQMLDGTGEVVQST